MHMQLVAQCWLDMRLLCWCQSRSSRYQAEGRPEEQTLHSPARMGASSLHCLDWELDSSLRNGTAHQHIGHSDDVLQIASCRGACELFSCQQLAP